MKRKEQNAEQTGSIRRINFLYVHAHLVRRMTLKRKMEDEYAVFDFRLSRGSVNFLRKDDLTEKLSPRTLFERKVVVTGDTTLFDDRFTLLDLKAELAVLHRHRVEVVITSVGAPDPVVAGTNLVTTVEVENSGPEDAANAHWSLTLPAG